jgi:pilus assembly protein CpaF
MSTQARLKKHLLGWRAQHPEAEQSHSPAPTAPTQVAAVAESQADVYQELKTRIHNRLIEVMDLAALEGMDPSELKSQIRKLVRTLLSEDFADAPLNAMERQVLALEVQDEVMGLGPLEPLLKDPTVSDLLVNGFRNIYVERFGRLERTMVRFRDDTHLRKIIERIVSRVGRRIDESSPMVDARLEDGSRVNAVIPPLALDGPSLSIRKFSKEPLELEDLIRYNTLTPQVGELLKAVVHARLNVLISGGTGSGKTTLLNVLSRFVPGTERIVTIEDAAELQLKQEHVVRLETRPTNIEGKGEVTQRDLVRNSLRMRPDRIIVGEVRGAEAVDMLQAMNTGHDGSLTTIHANSPRDALMRIETMVAMAGFDIPSDSLRRYVSSAIEVVLQVERLADGTRKIVSLQEITGMEGSLITMQEIFGFEKTGLGENGVVLGRFRATGIRPKFYDKLLAYGIQPDVILSGIASSN